MVAHLGVLLMVEPIVVPKAGLEPAHLAAGDFESLRLSMEGVQVCDSWCLPVGLMVLAGGGKVAGCT